MNEKSCECCILGAGPAGLGAALELTGHGVTDILIVDRLKIVGGLSRTDIFDGVRFDVGPHRFFTKNEEINRLWHDVLGDDFRPVSRMTRIYYKDEFFNYPLKVFDTLAKLGPVESLRIMVSFAASRIGKKTEPVTFEEWVTQKFGRKLYETFFKTYTEKVWGIPCSQIGAEWAAQRIKGLDVIQVIKNALPGMGGGNIKTLIEEFDYPRLGAGQMYEAMCDRASAAGAEVMLDSEIVSFNRKDNTVESIDIVTSGGDRMKIKAAQFFSSIPITKFFEMIDPSEPERIRAASDALYYRDHITVNLVVNGGSLFPDQWVYVHSPDVKMGRIANYNNFSNDMIPGKNKTALSIEYFAFQDDDLWQCSDDDLKSLAGDELARIGFADKKAVQQAWVVRDTESYPTYYLGFKEHYETLKSRLNEFDNLYPIGRGGLYKYNNQDHSVMSGILAARNYLKLPGTPYDLWEINVDAEYHESGTRPA